MHGEALGPAQQLLVERDEELARERGVHLEPGSRRLVLRLGRRPSAHAGLEALLDVHQPLVGLGRLAVGLLLRDRPARPRARGVELPRGGQRLDPLVHHRLGVGRLVALVVPEAPVADQIDQHVLVESVPVGHRQPHRAEARLGVVAVDVDDRDVEALGQVGRVAGRARVVHVGGEADLVVGDDVERAAGAVPLERAQVERLGHHALAGEGGIAVDGDRQRRGGVVMGVAPAALGLLGPGPAVHDRAPRTRGGSGLGDRVTVIDLLLPVRYAPSAPWWYFTSPVPPSGVSCPASTWRPPSNSAKIVSYGRPDRVGQHVEPPAVRHADHDIARAALGRALDREVEHRHQHVDAFDREPLLAEIGLVQELLERLDLGEPLEQLPLLVGRHRLAVGAALDLPAEPDPLLVGRDVLDLVGHGAAVGGLEVRQRLGERAAGHGDAEHLRRNRRHHLGREAERAGVERRIADGRRAERIEVRGQVAVHAEGLHQRHRRRHVVEHLRRDRAGGLLPGLGGRLRARELVAPPARGPGSRR